MTPHTRTVSLDGKPYSLRFTLAALAVLSRRLECPGPKALSRCLQSPDRPARLSTARVLLACLLSPDFLPPGEADSVAFKASETELAEAMTVMAEMIEEAFKSV
ncbi:hypothetical protein [Litorimonas haliclonae]|uniref:hypothetical protein n=1 Tax=Litorimonas haliclonae TaxID=2081977 RepID=UPI0039EEEA6C